METSRPLHSRAPLRESPIWPLLLIVVIAAAGGAAVTSLSGPYVVIIALTVVIVGIFFWRFGDPFVPFLVLVAAIQGGMLLQLQTGGGPVQSILPILGAWVLVTLLATRAGGNRSAAPSRAGRVMPYSAAILALLAIFTGLIQAWRPYGDPLSWTELLTLAQLGVLMLIAAYLLDSARRVVLMGYVIVGSGVLGSLLALADRAGVVALGTGVEMATYERTLGTGDDPNKFAYLLLVPLAFAVNLALASRSRRGKVVFSVAAAILGAGIVSTYSAGAVVGLVAVLVTTFVLQTRVSLKRGFVALGLFAGLTIVVALTVPQGYTEVVKEKYLGIASAPAADIATGRGARWEAGFQTFAQNPLLGSGLSTRTIQSAVSKNFTEATMPYVAPHNMYIAMAVGTGILGLAAFLVLLGSSLSALWSAYSKALETDQRDTMVATGALMTALIVTSTQGLQLDLEMEKYLWLLIGAALAVRYWPRESPEENPQDE